MLEPCDLGIVESELKNNGAYASTTRGVSMRPLFKTGRDVVVLEVPKGPLKKYDVALYKSNRGVYTLHRVVGVKEDEYLIRGDNTYALEHVKKDRILAVLTEFNRNGKKHKVTERGYMLYVRIWCFIYPVRYVCRLPRRYAAKAYRKLFPRK